MKLWSGGGMTTRISPAITAGRLVWSCFLLASFACGSAVAQTDVPYAIRVETPEVVVPVVVLDRSRRVVAATSYREVDEEVTDLSVSDFRVFEDGAEQAIDAIAMELPHIRDVQDNLSHHIEYSFTPRGIWASPDLSSADGAAQQLSPLATYLVTYTPPKSSSGSCHQIRVRVRRRHATVYARNEYCNVQHPLSDPMAGTRLGRKMQNYVDSGAKAEFPVFVQTGSYVDDLNSNRAEIAVEFSPGAVTRRWAGVTLYALVAVLGMVYDKNGSVVARFSDMITTLPWNFYRGPLPPDRNFLKTWENAAIPARYETQMDLPPGIYMLRVVVTDGNSFGWKEVPLTVDEVHQNDSLVSDIWLCKRFHNVLEGAQAAARAPKYLPFVSDGAEFTPAGDTQFRAAQKFVAYFQLCVPVGNPTESLQFRMRVRDVQSGALKMETDWREVSPAAQPHRQTIPVAAEMDIQQLPPGDYLFEVRARDSTTQRTSVRSRSFTME
jgi:hypothetical protein